MMVMEKLMAKKNGFFNKLIVGTEKTEDYVKGTLPTNRWELFWDVFKGNVVKLIGLNVLIILMFVAVFAIIIFKNAYISSAGQIQNFNQPFGTGYPAVPEFVGMDAQINLMANMQFLRFLPLAMPIVALGLAGGAYILRNMVWGEGVFIASDFIRGIKKNYVVCFLTAVIYSLIFVFLSILSDYANVLKQSNPNIAWLFTVSQVFIWAFIVFFLIMAIYMVTMGVTYELKFFALVKNAFLLTIGLFPGNVIILVASFLPFVFMLFGGIISFIGIFVMILLSFSLTFLIWTVYTQWVFDKHINVNLPKQYRNRGVYEKQTATNKEELEKYKRTKKFSDLTSRPIKPIDDDIVIDELPQSFRREDIERLNKQKEVMRKDVDDYVAEHYNDEQYVEARKALAQQQSKLDAEENERMLEMTRMELEGKKVKKNKKGKKKKK